MVPSIILVFRLVLAKQNVQWSERPACLAPYGVGLRVVFPAILAWEWEKSAVVWSEALEELLNADRLPRFCLVSSVIRAALSILLVEGWAVK